MAINPLQKPIDYFGAMPQIDIGKQFAEFGQILANRQKRTEAEAAKAAYKTDLQTVLNNPSMKAFNDFSLKYPQQREVIKDVATRFTQEQQDSEFNIGRDVAIALENDKPEVALELLNQTIDAREKSKLPVGVYGQIQGILANADDPDRIKKAKAQTNFALTLLNPEKFGKVVDSLAKQKLDPVALREQTGKADKAVQDAQNAVDTAPDDVAKAVAQRKLEEEKAKQEKIKTEVAEATQVAAQAKIIAESDKARSDADKAVADANKAVADKEKAVLEAGDTPARLIAEKQLRDAQAKKAEVDADFARANAVLEIDKKAAELGLTKAQTNEVKVKTRKLSIETQKAVLELEAFKKSGGLDPAKAFEQEEKLRKEYQTRTKQYQELGTTFETINTSAKAKNGPGDIALITGFMKMIDPGAIVRETDFALARDTAGLLQELKNQAGKLESGAIFTLDSKQRQQYVDLAQQYLNAGKKKADQDKKDLRVVVDNYKLNADNVFGAQGGGRGEINQIIPSQDAIDFLKKDPSRAAEFDKKYGPGSSAQYLKAK